jgi:hypothetical protein
MFIEKLELKNFRSHQHTTFEFERVNVIRGNHAAGKSTLALAIEFLLTNSCGVTDAAGRGADQLLMHGSDEFLVRGRIGLTADAKSPGAVIARSRNKAGGNLMIKAGSKNIVSKSAEGWLDEKLAPRPVLSAVLNAQRFLQMAEKDRKQLLTMALAADPVQLEPEIATALKQFEETVDLVDEGRIDDPAHAQLVYDKLYARRREVNATLRDLGALEEPERPKGMPAADETRTKMEGLRKELADLSRERATRVATHQANRERLARARQDLTELEPHLLEEGEMTLLTLQAGKKESAATLDSQITTTNYAILDGQRQIRELKADPGNCPTCGAARPKRDTSEQINHLEHKMEIATKDRDELQMKRDALGDPAAAEQKLQAHRRAVPKVAAAEKTIAELGEIEHDVDVTDIDEKIARLGERIAKGDDVLRRIHTFEGELAAYQREKKQREDLEHKVHTLEHLVNYFGPNGELRPLLMGDKLTGFAASMNEVLKRFGFFCELSLEPFSVRVTYLRGDEPETSWPPLDLGQLSESEAFRFGVAFQIALAEATGVNLVVIDRADVLLPGTQRFLNAALMDSKLDQAFVLAAKEDFSLKSAPPAGVKIFDLGKDEQGHTQVADIHQAEKELEYARD